MSLIYLGGINGVGKTTIAQETAKRFPTLRILHGATELMKSLGVSVGDYDSLRKISEEVKGQAAEEIFRNLATESQNADRMVVAHYVKILNGIITPNYGLWYGYCQRLVLVVSPPEEILDRINSDANSGRRVQRNLFGARHPTRQKRVKFLERAQRVSNQVMRKAAEEFHIPSFRVENLNGEKTVAVNQLACVIQGR